MPEWPQEDVKGKSSHGCKQEGIWVLQKSRNPGGLGSEPALASAAPSGKGVARAPSLCLEIRMEEVCGAARLLVD